MYIRPSDDQRSALDLIAKLLEPRTRRCDSRTSRIAEASRLTSSVRSRTELFSRAEKLEDLKKHCGIDEFDKDILVGVNEADAARLSDGAPRRAAAQAVSTRSTFSKPARSRRRRRSSF